MQHKICLKCNLSSCKKNLGISCFYLWMQTKALGPNGFTVSFFQRHWELVKRDVFQVAEIFFGRGFLLKEFNHTDIALIPKVRSLVSIKFRPISLCNVIYKILSKVMVLRLNLYLQRIIHHNRQLLYLEGISKITLWWLMNAYIP